jgi:hypothetical protein
VRRFWYAGAALTAGGILLFGAAPAQADELLPGTDVARQQADQQLADLLGQSNGLSLENPLRHSSLQDSPAAKTPLMQFKSGQNTPDTNRILPGESTSEPRPQLPAADVMRNNSLNGTDLGSPFDSLPVQQLPVNNVPLNGLLGGGLPLLGGLNPNGEQPSAVDRPTVRQAEAFSGGLPLLGGLGGLLPVNDLPGKPDTSGLPAGGTAVQPADTTPAPTAAARPSVAPSPAFSAPAPAEPADKTAPADKPKPAATPDDPRLHEEPIDDDSEKREFSPNGRPIGAVDPEYN